VTETLNIRYGFACRDREEKSIQVVIDADRMELCRPETPPPPAWARLTYHQCPNCPLTEEASPFCPLMAGLAGVLESFNDLVSYDEVDLVVETAHRRIRQHTTAQRGIGSLMGLLSATSGCPRTAFLKPMARFHLPLADDTETAVRSISLYLLGQFLRQQQGLSADATLEGLSRLYADLHIVNTTVALRLREAVKTDSSVNALIQLDLHAQNISYIIEESLEELRPLFAAYLQS
jgi:hypothetical protein